MSSISKLMLLGAIAIGISSSSCTGAASAQADNQSIARTDSAAVIDNILNRRSIRAYEDRPVEREKLELIAKCGINAPSGMNQQPWQIRIVDDAAYINAVTDIFRAAQPERASEPGFKNMFRNAPALIFVATSNDMNGALSGGLLGENMCLAAEAMGLGTCIQGGPLGFMKTNPDCAPFIEKLNIPEDYTLLYVIGVGYPAESPDAKPRDPAKIQFID